MHILVVDDDSVMAELLQYFLEEQGLSVTTATSLVEALQHLQTEAFDLVVSDLVMPGGGGPFLVANLHKNQPHIPIIIISGYGSGDLTYPRSQTRGFWRKGDAIDRLVEMVKTSL